MKVYSIDTFQPLSSPIVATIGMFDGVHHGHRYLINQLMAQTKRQGAQSMVLTFTSHPKQLFAPHLPLSLLNTVEEKVNLLEQCGVENCILLNFDKQLAEMSAAAFIEKILHCRLNIQTLLIGYDNHFGKGRKENFDEYVQYGKRFGIDVIKTAPYYNNGITVSSSLIRRYLSNGELEKANQCLGYDYNFTGKVIKGFQIGRTLGFPTANLVYPVNKLLPAYGAYAVEVEIDNLIKKGILNIGTRPTVHAQGNIAVEAHIFDFSESIYEKEIIVRLKHYLRPEHRFASTEELQRQIQKDKEIALLKLQDA